MFAIKFQNYWITLSFPSWFVLPCFALNDLYTKWNVHSSITTLFPPSVKSRPVIGSSVFTKFLFSIQFYFIFRNNFLQAKNLVISKLIDIEKKTSWHKQLLTCQKKIKRFLNWFAITFFLTFCCFWFWFLITFFVIVASCMRRWIWSFRV